MQKFMTQIDSHTSAEGWLVDGLASDLGPYAGAEVRIRQGNSKATGLLQVRGQGIYVGDALILESSIDSVQIIKPIEKPKRRTEQPIEGSTHQSGLFIYVKNPDTDADYQASLNWQTLGHNFLSQDI